VSDLHVGRRDTPAVVDALRALVAEVDPEIVIASGDLSHRGRPEQLAAARALLEQVDRPYLAIPGNHDLPHAFPARFTRPSARFAATFGTTQPVYRSERLVVCGLDSTWPWRHQGGRLTEAALEHAAAILREAPTGALRVVALHHHLCGAPWRTSRKLPLSRRDHALRALADAGAELVIGGHIHQCAVSTRAEFEVLDEGEASPVLVTAPGLGRPRPHRTGEAQGAVVYEWDDDTLVVVPHIVTGATFRPSSRCELARRQAPR
jgi:3',5'-cyclic AMP phosphodiesterase CpdA